MLNYEFLTLIADSTVFSILLLIICHQLLSWEKIAWWTCSHNFNISIGNLGQDSMEIKLSQRTYKENGIRASVVKSLNVYECHHP